MNQPMPDANAFLMGGAKSASFPTLGTTVAGVIVQEPQTTQVRNPKDNKPEYWNNDPTQPKMQLVVTLRTNDRDVNNPLDDGERRLFVKGNMRKAIAAAVRAAGATGLAVGGVLSVTYTADGVKPSATLSAPKEYRAKYIPPKPREVPVEQAPSQDPAKDPGAQSASSPEELSEEEAAALQALMGD